MNDTNMQDTGPYDSIIDRLEEQVARLKGQRATHQISASYFPKKGVAEITIRHLGTKEYIELAVPVSTEDGEWLSEMVPWGVYHTAQPSWRTYRKSRTGRAKTLR